MQQGNGLVIADVIQTEGSLAGAGIRMIAVPVGGWTRHDVTRPLDTFGDIIDVSEIPLHVPFIEDVDGPAFEDGFREQEQRHVGSPPGSVNRKETQAGGGKTIEMAVGMSHQLIGFFRGRVKA